MVKPDAWRGGPWSIKNIFELKTGVRVLVARNRFSGNWTQAQTGTAILLKSTNQECTAPWSETGHVTFVRNAVDRTEGA